MRTLPQAELPIAFIEKKCTQSIGVSFIISALDFRTFSFVCVWKGGGGGGRVIDCRPFLRWIGGALG